MQEIIIKFSKKKLIILLFLSFIFTYCSINFISNPEKFVTIMYPNKNLIRFTGYLGVCSFGISSISIFLKLFNKKPGLVINSDGIIFHASANTLGLIKWKDVTDIKTYKFYNQNYILIMVKNPKEYLNKFKHVKKFLYKRNLNNNGTPIFLSSAGLQCNSKEMEKLLKEEFNRYQSISK
ncbi:STM3941 family protein [Apibacter adventoris]|uniref:STM3941 family protein n=1 Tax=Apibacter adventoris TaxID=1679466 RepID=UPI000CF6E2B2|nr:STM3941 family protein [Apibacter adventoris]PQL93359.1 hypothetical protein C4S76_08995 [Apibacter adventoris]